MTMLQTTMDRLSQEMESAGKADLFEALRPHLFGEADAESYRVIGEQVGLREGAVKVAAYRLRDRCRQILREEIGKTVSDPDEIDDELQALMQALG